MVLSYIAILRSDLTSIGSYSILAQFNSLGSVTINRSNYSHNRILNFCANGVDRRGGVMREIMFALITVFLKGRPAHAVNIL